MNHLTCSSYIAGVDNNSVSPKHLVWCLKVWPFIQTGGFAPAKGHTESAVVESVRGCYTNWPIRHPMPTGLSMDKTQLHGKAGICLCYPHENSTTEEWVLLFEAEKSFGENKSLLMVRGEISIFEEFGKALVVFQTFDIWFKSDPEEGPRETTPPALLWFSLMGEKS